MMGLVLGWLFMSAGSMLFAHALAFDTSRQSVMCTATRTERWVAFAALAGMLHLLSWGVMMLGVALEGGVR